MTSEHLNPPDVYRHPAFSQAVVVRQPTATIYVGGQNALDPEGGVVGDDLPTQTAAALDNLEAVLRSAGAEMTDIVRCTVAVVDGQPLEHGAQVFAERWGGGSPPAVSVHRVAGLANPDFLVEIDAVAAV